MEGAKRVAVTLATNAVRDMVPGTNGLEVTSRPGVLPENATVVAKSVVRSMKAVVNVFIVLVQNGLFVRMRSIVSCETQQMLVKCFALLCEPSVSEATSLGQPTN